MSENGIHFNRERFDKRKNKSTRNSIVLVVLLLVLIGAWIYLSKTAKGAAPASTETSIKSDMKKVTDFFLTGKNGAEVSLAEYKGKVLLIVNTATGCGFTPQYNELEAMYKKLKDKGFEILDIPCNQFGNQTPGTDEEITEADNKLTPILEKMFDENAPGWRETSDIKWNFTKFLVNRDGDVVARFEPTCSMDKVEQAVEALL